MRPRLGVCPRRYVSTHCPYEEGIETATSFLYLLLSVFVSTHCPYEEGIETSHRCAVRLCGAVSTHCPYEEGIKTVRLRGAPLAAVPSQRIAPTKRGLKRSWTTTLYAVVFQSQRIAPTKRGLKRALARSYLPRAAPVSTHCPYEEGVKLLGGPAGVNPAARVNALPLRRGEPNKPQPAQARTLVLPYAYATAP